MYQGPSFSTIAVNSFRMSPVYRVNAFGARLSGRLRPGQGRYLNLEMVRRVNLGARCPKDEVQPLHVMRARAPNPLQAAMKTKSSLSSRLGGTNAGRGNRAQRQPVQMPRVHLKGLV
jgi:hypothetical protein